MSRASLVNVPVRAGLLMVKAEGVEELMVDGAVVQTALSAQRHRLTTPLTAHVGVTAGTTVTYSMSLDILFKVQTKVQEFYSKVWF